MTNVFQLIPKGTKPEDDQPEGEVLGQIHIIATADGDSYSVTGTFADRLQHAAVAMIKTLSEIADKIRDSGHAGHTSSPPLRDKLDTRRRLPAAFLETTDLAPLEEPRRKKRCD
jgi:hypothetical protein